jgi:hypothetical protein
VRWVPATHPLPRTRHGRYIEWLWRIMAVGNLQVIDCIGRSIPVIVGVRLSIHCSPQALSQSVLLSRRAKDTARPAWVVKGCMFHQQQHRTIKKAPHISDSHGLHMTPRRSPAAIQTNSHSVTHGPDQSGQSQGARSAAGPRRT